ncbi:MAG: cohesin domain-containing protein, partial [Candidatus Poribacteria bacterium]|nr:cohesin domain-containing protein [Candidatus Poribacteria bacterium]
MRLSLPRRTGWVYATLIALIVAASTANAAPQLRLDTDVPLLDVGAETVVRLQVSGAESLFGASMKVVYDSARLQFLSSEVGDLFLFGAQFPPLVTVAENGNTLAVSTSRNIGDVSVSRDGVLVELRFRALTTGIANISI